MECQVTIQIGGRDVLVGRLFTTVRRGVERASFLYDESYLKEPQAFPLAPDMPLTSGTIYASDAPMFRIFQDCMPDRWGRNLMKRAERNAAKEESRTARTLFEGDMLVGVNDTTRQGALRIWQDGVALADPREGVPREVSIPDLLSSADRAAKDMNADVRDLLAAGSSLGGARPKASVQDEQGRLNIAKFPRADENISDDVGAWEKTVLQLASEVGIRVPGTRLLRVRGRSVLLLKRFDRTDDGGRIPYMSGMTAVQGVDGGHYSFLELVEFLEEWGSNPNRDIRELWKRALFDTAVGNTDNHMRNQGFLKEERGWTLSPAFDVNPTIGDNPKILNTAIDYDSREADPEVALSVCEYYRTSLSQAKQIARETADRMSDWRRAAVSNGISASSIEAMSSCFESGIERLRKIAG
ncbi:phosphatidylinositol kinase [Bifidobacterium lemurum]|uniref:Phosphatidylinositol kinase n=1 Tax=Bifidobacterium lemurum TaxID=1603886 RepID=A0A261FX74_9BIFI|nr:type II toxin-antitoxin system HipA family toxin [Bifidobacterium lemurum]OZG63356.1 phosphatidylinositol kinase [Bifidobacterium lemurum]QOL34266.1 type II toxin-antitoxin system HipA family toxin [Bifidobacterium lemurum]